MNTSNPSNSTPHDPFRRKLQEKLRAASANKQPQDSGQKQTPPLVPALVNGNAFPMHSLTPAVGAAQSRAVIVNGAANGHANAAEEVHRPGISTEMLRRAKITHVNEQEAARLTGHAVRGIAIPYLNFDGSAVIGGDGRPFYRIRVDEPRSSAKYLSATKSGCQLYIPPGLRQLLQPGCTLLIVEGEFKSMALVEAGFPCVGIGGISCAAPRSSETGEPELLPALVVMISEVRPSRLAFIGDSDTALISAFSREAVKLAKLTGLPVVLPRIPYDAPGKGADDLRAVWGEEFHSRWQAILDGAEPVSLDTKTPQLAIQLLRREAEALKTLSAGAKETVCEKLVKLASDFKEHPLTHEAIVEIAAATTGVSRTTFRAAIRTTKQKPDSPAKGAHEDKDVHLLILPGGDVPITTAATAIFSVIAPTRELFFRGGHVHELAANPDGTVRLVPINGVQFRSRVENYGMVVGKCLTWT